MNKFKDDIQVVVDSLNETAEGQLKGGFAVIGGSSDSSPMRLDNGCTNDGCHNYKESCDNATNNGCTNHSTCKPTTPSSRNSGSTIGMTFSI